MIKNDDWFDIKLLIYCNKVCDNKKYIKHDSNQNSMKVLFNKLKIFSNCFVHFGRGIVPIELELKKVEPQYIKNIGNWKPYTQYECYLYNMPINILNIMTGSSENLKIQYKPSTVPKPPEELQILVFC